MKGTCVAGFALAAVCAFCAIVVTSAFAADEWLADGAPITAALSAETPIELALIALEKAGGAFVEEILCSLIMDGTVGPGAEGVIEDILSLTGETIGELEMANEKPLSCTVTSNNAMDLSACKLNTLVEVWLDNLNLELVLTWKTQIELMGAEPLFLNHLFGGGAGKEVGYEFKCEINLGVKIEELCESLRSAALENVVGGVQMTFNWENPIGTEAAECTLLGVGTGTLKGSGITKLTNGKALTIS